MSKPYSLSLHIFRRDLRLQDNSALIQALSMSDTVIPCFILDKRQLELNDYKSDHAVQFMLQSLQSLNQQLQAKQSRLFLFYGIAEEVIEQLLQHETINAVFINRDYTPFSRARDQRIETLCRKYHADFHCYADALLHEPEEVHKPNGEPYTVYTHFFNKASTLHVNAPHKNTAQHYFSSSLTGEDTQHLDKLIKKYSRPAAQKGGREEGLRLLRRAASSLQDYAHSRDIPAKQGTSHLSAHLKFGTVSIREVHTAIVNYLGVHHTLIRELYWRDFFTHIGFHFPRVFGAAFHEKYASLKWTNDTTLFRAWCEGRTGFPIVDAGMRELNTTGYMHNRVRMITASFLVKDCHIDWRWGEKYFAQKLVDYDPAVNNGNWQWAASTGCDAQPYFRIFNPWLQQKKFDPECLYIKRWIPELAALLPTAIHDLASHPAHMSNYPAPVLDHARESQIAKQQYRFAAE